MGFPVLGYFSDQLFGIKPPAPALLPCSAPNAAGCIPSVAGDGGRFTLTTTTLAYFNKSNTQVWSLSASTINFSGSMTGFAGFMCVSGVYYALLFRTGAVGLISLTTPYTANNYTAVSVTIPVTNTFANTAVYQSYLMPSGSNFRMRFLSLTDYYDLIFSATAKISETLVTQNNGQSANLGNLSNGATYESVDGSIQASIVGNSANGLVYTLFVGRNGKVAGIPINWHFHNAPSGGYSVPILLNTSIYFASSANFRLGYYCVDRADFDRYLKEICDVMGL